MSIVVGDDNVNKLELLQSYARDRCQSSVPAVVYDNYPVNITIAGMKHVLYLNDCSGLGNYKYLREACYPPADVILVCFSVTNPHSFKNVKNKVRLLKNLN